MLDQRSLLDLALINSLEAERILERFRCVRVRGDDTTPSQCINLDGDSPVAHCRSHGMKLPVALLAVCPLVHVDRIASQPASWPGGKEKPQTKELD